MWLKTATSVGSATVDETQSQGAVTPTAPVVVANKPAPGQTGPKGLAPRTTYSRVNTGETPLATVGESAKATPPRGLESLPAKVAHQEFFMNHQVMSKPTIQDLVKEAMEGTASKVNITNEAARQLGYRGEQFETSKTASASVPSVEHIPTDVIEKYAGALEHLAKLSADPGSAENASPGVGPGQGPGNNGVLESNVTQDNPIEAGRGGEAKPSLRPAENPALAAFSDSKGPANAMATNIDTEHGEQPTDPIGNEHASNAAQKQASALASKNLDTLSKLAKSRNSHTGSPVKDFASTTARTTVAGGLLGAAKGAIQTKGGAKERALGAAREAAHGAAGGAAIGATAGALRTASNALHGEYKKKGGTKEASAILLHAKNLDVLAKLAEDAINPAQISAGKADAIGAEAPDGVSASEEGPIPAVPGDVSSQQRFVSSNQAAIDYTKREAKADPKKDLNKLLTEPALSVSGDKILSQAFDHTEAAGAKIAGLTKSAAAKAVLLKLAASVEADKAAKAKKEKLSTMGGGGLSTPSGQSGFTASSM